MLNQVNKLFHKKYFCNLIIILLLLVSLYLVILNNNKSYLIEENYAKQQLIDKNFINYLSQTQSDFGVDFLKIQQLDVREKLYSQCLIDLSSAFSLAEYTTYNNTNSSIDVTLYSLLRAMQDDDTSVQIMKDSKKIFYMLNDILYAPSDSTKLKPLSDYLDMLNKKYKY